MIKLLRYLKNYKLESILGPLFKLTEAIFELFVPLVMAKIIDVGIYQKDFPYIMKMCMILILLGILGLVCSLTAQYFAAKAAVGFGTKLRNDMMRHINQFSFTELDGVGTSTLITRITNDINQTQTAVNLALRLFLRSPFIVIGAMIMAFTIHKGLAIIFVIGVPILCFVIFYIMIWSIPFYKKIQKKLEEVLLIVQENLMGVRVVRAFAKEEDEIQDFCKKNDGLREIQVFVGKIVSLLNPITYVIINIAILVLLWFGGKRVNIGEVTQGELIALINYMIQILMALIVFAFLIANFIKGVATAARVIEVLEIEVTDMPCYQDVPCYEDSTIVELKNVSFAYKQSKLNALQHISLTIKRGETIGIIGGTGSGKSTLINMIAGFYQVSSGERRVTSDKIGIVPQKAILFEGTIRDNMKWGKKEASDDEIWRAIKISQSSDIVKQKGEGLDFSIEQGGSNLSGGQRQRLTIARTLVGNPELLILDDSLSALDVLTDKKLREALRKNKGNMTVVLVSGRITSVKDADRIIVLDEGEMVGIGTHEKLRENCSVYEEICISQGGAV